MQGILQAVFITALLVVKSESTHCEFGETLLDLARLNPIWLDTGDVRGFKHEVNGSGVTMCFYHHSLDQCGVDISGYYTGFPCDQQCQQHSKENTEFRITKYIDGTNKLIAIIINARMLAPSDTLDTAYVLRVWNETVIYYVRGGHCSASDSLDMSRPVTWLLENPIENCTLGPTETPSPSSTTSATPPSIEPSKQEGTNNPSIQSPGSIAAVILGIVIIGGVILTALCVLGAGYYFYEVNHRRNRPRDEHHPEVAVTEEANSNSSSRSDLTSIWQGSHLSKDSGRGGSSSRRSTT